MNYLGHLYLSGEDEEIITGNFIADHVKGRAISQFNEGIRSGILLHREIDTYTDSHPAFIQSKGRLAVNFRKYAGVITDMFYDHFLSKFWKDYSNENIDDFTSKMYAIVLKRFEIIPGRAKRLLTYMARDNWLKGYGKIEGLSIALNGMASRTRFDSGMEKAVDDLQENYMQYYNDFSLFLPDITSHFREKVSREFYKD
jgi:acyl carrier protein phosphodiesterase